MLWLGLAAYLEVVAVLELAGNGASNTMADWIGWLFVALTVVTLLTVLVHAWERGAPRQRTDDLRRIADAAEALARTGEVPAPEPLTTEPPTPEAPAAGQADSEA